MKKLLSVFLFFSSVVGAMAGEHSTANMRVEYKYEYAIPYRDSISYRTDRMALQIAPDESRFFSIATEFYDSIVARPGGKEMISQMAMDALNNSGGIVRDTQGNIKSVTVTPGAFAGVPKRVSSCSVYKRPALGMMTVFDLLRTSDDSRVCYEVPMDDLVWEPGDSVTTILGYECQNATADYHGRRWTAWFAPDLSVSEGPWQLYGLPGLIMMAESEGGEYRFTVTSVRECNEQIGDIPGLEIIDMITRMEFLKQADDLRRHPSKAYGITNRDPEYFHDLIETDYK